MPTFETHNTPVNYLPWQRSLVDELNGRESDEDHIL
jgi:hypothetical protein